MYMNISGNLHWALSDQNQTHSVTSKFFSIYTIQTVKSYISTLGQDWKLQLSICLSGTSIQHL